VQGCGVVQSCTSITHLTTMIVDLWFPPHDATCVVLYCNALTLQSTRHCSPSLLCAIFYHHSKIVSMGLVDCIPLKDLYKTPDIYNCNQFSFFLNSHSPALYHTLLAFLLKIYDASSIISSPSTPPRWVSRYYCRASSIKMSCRPFAWTQTRVKVLPFLSFPKIRSAA